MNLSRKRTNLLFDIGLFVAIVIVLLLISKNILNVIGPFVIALVIAYLLDPLVNLLQKKGLKRTISVVLVFLIILAVVTGIFMTFVPKLISDVSVFIADLPNIFSGIGDYINKSIIKFNSTELSSFINIDKELANLSSGIKTALGVISTKLLAGTGKIVNAIMIPLITFYYLKDKEEFLGLLSESIPNRFKSKLKKILNDIDGVIGGFIRGQLLVAIFVGILTGVGCRIIGLPYSLTIGLVAGVTNIIPYFGPWIGGILPVVLAIITNPVLVIWVLVLIVVIQQIESNFISPQIMSKSVGLHPMAVIFSIVLFGNMFGVVGMIIGVPIAGVTKVLIKYITEYRQERSVD